MSALSKFFKRGIASVESDDDALERLREAVSQDPRSLQFVPLADFCRKRKFYDEAISVCQAGLEFHPTYVSGYVELARAFQESGAAVDALHAYHRVVDLAPQNLVGHLGLGELYEEQGRYAVALQHFVTAQRLGAESTELDAHIQRLSTLLEGPDNRFRTYREGSVTAEAGNEEFSSALLRSKIAALDAYWEAFHDLES